MQKAIPEAMIGPAATPRRKTTPKIVPKTKATVTSGEMAKNPTPRAERIDTNIPQNMAIHPTGDLKAFSKSEKPTRPVAIGIKIATVIMVTPQLIPCFSIRDNNFDELGIAISTKTAAVANIKD